MKLAMSRSVLITITSLLCSLNEASSKSTGTLNGQIVDAQTGDPLFGAAVFLQDTNYGTICDMDGRFNIPHIPLGTYTLKISMIGYQNASVVDIEVTPESSQPLEIALNTEAIQLEDAEVVVEAKALKNTGAALLRQRQKAPAVSDAISAEEISRAGSSNAADAIKHVTGASVVEGKYVYIRGLGDRYSSVQLNGASLPSSDPDKRAVPMDLFPSSLLDNIVTTKSFTPDKPGNFTGGNVDISTKAFPDNFKLSISSSTSYNTKSSLNDNFLAYEGSESNWNGSADDIHHLPEELTSRNVQIPHVGSSFNNLENAEKIDRHTKSFSTVMTPVRQKSDLNQSYSISIGNQADFLKRPLGFLATVSFNKSSSFYENGTSARWQLTSSGANTLTNNYALSDNQGNQETSVGGLFTLSYRPITSSELTMTYMSNRNGESSARYLSGSFPRDLEENALYETRVLQFTERKLDSFQLSGKHKKGINSPLELTWSVSQATTTQEEPDLRFFTNHSITRENRPLKDADGNVLRDINENVIRGQVTTHSIAPSIYPLPTRYFRDMEESNQEVQLDLSWKLTSWNKSEAKVKSGGRFLKKNRQFRERRFEIAQDKIKYDGNPDTFFRSENLGLISEDENQYRFYNYVQDASQLSSNFDGDQRISATYLMLEIPLNPKIRLVGGARFERTDMDVSSQDSTKAKGGLQNDDVLPAINLAYEVDQQTNIRMSYGRTLARPSFRELAPFASFSFVGDFTFIGNPKLKRTTVGNYDIRWERFGKPGEIYAVSFFAKQFKNPIERVILTVNGQVQFQNVSQARVRGIELEGRRSLNLISEKFKFFTFGGNISLVESEVSIGENELTLRKALDPNVSDKRPLQGQSPYLINLDFSYDNYNSGTTIGLYFNVFGKRLSEVSLGGTPDVYERPRNSLDLTASKRWRDLKIKLTSKNILNYSVRKTYEFKEQLYTSSDYTRGRSFSVSLNYSPR